MQLQHHTICRNGITLGLNGFDVGVSETPSMKVVAGWYRPARDFLAEFKKAFGRSPNATEEAQIAYQARLIRDAMANHDELAFEHHHGVMDFYLRNDRLPTGYPANDRGENLQLVNEARARVDQHVAAYHAAHPSFVDVITSPVRDVTGKILTSATGKEVVVTSVSVSPKEFAQAVQAVLSFVPVIGTGINAAIAAGAALASGSSIDDAFIAAAANAVPGGPIAAQALKSGVAAVKAIANGQNVGDAALSAAREAIPDETAKHAFDIGIALAHGQNIQNALVSAGASLAAGQLSKIALPPALTDVARSLPPETTRIATAIYNNADLAKQAVTAVAKALNTTPETVAAATNAVNTAKASEGMKVLANLTPQQQRDLVAYTALSKLTPEQQKQLVAMAQKKPITVHETGGSKPAPAKKPITVHETSMAGRYPPYPTHMSGTVSAPPPHHPMPHHDGGRRPQRFFRGGWGGWWDAPSVVVTQAPTCRTWGDPVGMSHTLQVAAKAALGASGGRPTVARAPDGVLYLFAFEAGGGLSARPCAA